MRGDFRISKNIKLNQFSGLIKPSKKMEKLQIKTRKGNREPKYLTNIDSVTTFLRHSDDKITVINGETINIEIYKNGSLIFSGDKGDLFELLKLAK